MTNARCPDCGRLPHVLKVLWWRVRCDVVSTDRLTKFRLVEAIAIVNGDCRGPGCDGCYFRSCSGADGEHVRYFAA